MGTTMRALAMAGLVFSATAFAGHTTSPVPTFQDDMNGDGYADIVFSGGTALAYWASNGSSHYVGNAGPGYTVVAVSDFTGDYAADVLWTNGSHLKLWVNNGSGGFTSVSVGNYGGGWVPFAAGDINGDHKADLFFRGGTHLAFWLMNGPSVISSSYAGNGGAGWRVIAINHFFTKRSGEKGVDVLWTDGSQFKFWEGDAPKSAFHPYSPDLGSYGGGWEPFGAGDVNGDGIADILFRGGTHIAYWLLRDGTSFDLGRDYTAESRYGGDGGAGFRVVAVSDYNNDFRTADLLWTNGSQFKKWVNGSYWCDPWGYDGCQQLPHTSPVFDPYGSVPIFGTYGGGWAPLDMLIPVY